MNRFVFDKKNSQRLDRFLKSCLNGFSMQNIRDLLANQAFIVEGKTSAPSKGLLLQRDDIVCWPDMPDLSTLPIPNKKLSLTVHFEDSHLMVIEKPAKIAVHPLSPTETDTLANVLVAKRPELVGIGKNPLEPGIVHRLDNGTSGLLLIAKSDHCFEKLLLLFRRHQLSKEYLALVEGKVAKSGEISSLLTHHPTEKERMMIAPKTKKIHPQHKKFNKSWPATTLFQPILHLDQHTLLRVRIPTGVTHQIRLHLSHLGHPVVGDTLYGKKSSMMPANSSRHFLHAYRLQFTHPITHQPIDCISTLPSDLQEILDSIGSKDRC